MSNEHMICPVIVGHLVDRGIWSVTLTVRPSEGVIESVIESVIIHPKIVFSKYDENHGNQNKKKVSAQEAAF